MTSLILTNEKVRALTKGILQGRSAVEQGQMTYLQGLIETTQKELGAEPRQRASKAAKLNDAGVEQQLAALTKVHERCYAIVLEVCSEGLPTGAEKAKELNRRSNFARTAMSLARAWIRSGKDLTALAAARVTKHSLRVELAKRQPSPTRLARRVERGITELIEDATQLAAADKPAAIQQLKAAMAKIVTMLSAIGGNGHATRDPAKAIAERIPLKTAKGVFYPAEGVAA